MLAMDFRKIKAGGDGVGYAKCIAPRILAATRKRCAHVLANQTQTEFQNELQTEFQNENSASA